MTQRFIILALATVLLGGCASVRQWATTPEGQQQIVDGIRIGIQVAELLAVTAPVAAAVADPTSVPAVSAVCQQASALLDEATAAVNTDNVQAARGYLTQANALLARYQLHALATKVKAVKP